jgi:hypothetical protein
MVLNLSVRETGVSSESICLAAEVEMASSKNIAALLGPAIVAITLSEAVNIHIWAGNTAAGVHFNGAVIFVTGIAIVRAHNHWIRGWPVLITLAGWLLMLLGLFRMFFPELQLEAAKHTSTVGIGTMFLLAGGIFLTFKAYRREG